MIKRQAFYPNGEMIDFRLPTTFAKSYSKRIPKRSKYRGQGK